MELMIFAAFYAVAFVAHAIVAARSEDRAAHRFALVLAVAAKAAHAALHDYAIHFVEVLIHVFAR